MRPLIKWIVIAVVVIALLGVFWFVFVNKPEVTESPAPAPTTLEPEIKVIGQSVEGRDITAYTYVEPGAPGGRRLLFVGGVHGGYEWNSVLLAYEFMDFLKGNPGTIPRNVAVTIIPNANPDGVFEVVRKEGRFTVEDVQAAVSVVPSVEPPPGLGRFNAHDVDLNRNFDCKWKPTSMWRSKTVSAGTAPFSEPEAAALRDFILETSPVAAIFWHSQANAVYASECKEGILPETLNVMNTYASAAGYPAVQSFDAYEISGDAEGWLASIGIPAITVELKTHETIEWDKNLAGVKALLKYFGE